MTQKWLFICYLLLHTLGQAQSLEETIYSHIDLFIENPTPETLRKIEAKEITFFTKVKTPEEQLALVILQCNMGYYQKQFGDNTKAIRSYEKAWQRFSNSKLESYDIIEFCLKPLGNLYTITGDFTNAENTIKKYIIISESQKNIPQKIAGIINLSVVYHNTGNHQIAIALLREGLQTPNLSKSQKAALENNLATNLFAIKRFEEAQQTIDHLVFENKTVNSYKNAAQLAVQQHSFLKAHELLDLAETELLKNPFSARDIAKLYVEKAQVYALEKEDIQAENHLQKALLFLIPTNSLNKPPKEELIYPENTLLDIFDGLASLQQNTEQSLRYYDLSFLVSEQLLDQYTAQEAKIIHQTKQRIRSEKCIELLLEEYNKKQNKNHLSRAFAYAEKSKATVLTEIISRKTLLENYPKDTLLLKQQQLTQRQEASINYLVRAQVTNADTKSIQNSMDTLNQLNLQLKEIKLRVEQKYPKQKIAPISIENLQKKLTQDNAFLLEYFYGKNAIYLFEITQNSLQLSKIKLDEAFKKTLSTYLQSFENASIINNNIPAFTENAFLLFQKLQLEYHSKQKNVIIIPDGLLHFVTFEALLTKATHTSNFAEMPFLVRSHRIAYNTTANLYLQSKMPETENNVLGVFPVFENTPQTLSHSLTEAENIQKLMPTTLLMREQASKENFIKKAKNYSILHLSTHANSGTFVIPASLAFYEDALLLQELYSLNFQPKLVVLSACETGVGKIKSGEGAMSLARGFQHAGAQNLLFSLWKVNDLATAQIMTSFYKNYSKTNAVFMANRQSKLEYLNDKTISNTKKSPYYWSSFVYYGTLEEEKQSPMWYWVLGALLLFILFFVFRMQWKKKRNK